jgi:hypothetical protein
MANNRRLNFIPEDDRIADGFVQGPCVLVTSYADGETVYTPVHAITLELVHGQYHIGAAQISGVRYYPIDKVSDAKISDSSGTLSFASYGNMYKVRAFQESDGSWASRFGAVVPAESLEERYMAEVENAFSPNAPSDDENLYVATSDGSDEVKYLVYSTTSGLYIRSNGGWFRLPADDESLDDLVVHEMSPKVIKIFDMFETDNDILSLEDIAKYEVPFRGAL